MNVAVLSTISRRAGGLFFSVRWLSKTLVEQGCRLQVFSAIDRFSQEDLAVWDPIPVRLYRGWGPMQMSLRLRHELTDANADLLHVHGLWLDSQCAAWQQQKKRGIPVLVSPRGMLDPWAVNNAAWKKRLVGALFANEALRKATCIHALCQAEADAIRAYGLTNAIAIIPNGVFLPELGARKPQKRTRKRLVFLGRIHPKKGLRELLEAWSGGNGPWRSQWMLTIAGWDDGGYERGLRDLANKLGINDSIEFVGAKYGEEKDDLLCNADAFILPSFSEGLPMSILEAWSYGLPVIMTDHCNLQEGYAAGAAIRVSPDVDSIADGLMQLSGLGSDELDDMGARGRKLVERCFSWNRIARDMKTVYEWCLGGDKPACIVDA